MRNKQILVFVILFSLFFIQGAALLPVRSYALVVSVAFFFFDAYLLLKRNLKNNRVFLRWQMAFILFCAISILWAVSRHFSLYVIGMHLIPLFLSSFFIVNYATDRSTFKVFLWAFYLSAVAEMAYLFLFIDIDTLFLTRFGDSFSDDSLEERLNGIYIAGRFVFAIYFGYYLFFKLQDSSKFLKVFFWTITALMLFFILLSGSRMALIMLVVPIVVMNIGSSRRIGWLILSAIVIVAGGVFIINNDVLYEILGKRVEDFFNILSGNAQGTEDDSRIRLIKLGLNKFIEQPVIGYGINCFRHFARIAFMGRNYYAHNNYVELLVDVGIVGFAIYYSVYSYFLKSYKRLKGCADSRFLLALILLSLLIDMAWVSYYNSLSQDLICFIFILIQLNISQSTTNETYRHHSSWIDQRY